MLHSSRYAGYFWPKAWRAWQMDENRFLAAISPQWGAPARLCNLVLWEETGKSFYPHLQKLVERACLYRTVLISRLRFEDGGLAVAGFPTPSWRER